MARKKYPDDPRNFEGMSDDYIIQVITEDMERAYRFQRPFFEKFAEYYKLYNSEIDSDHKRADGANLFIPYIYNIVETMVPRILNSILETKPLISYKPVNVDDIDKARKMTALVAYQMKQFMKASTRLYEIIKSSMMYGTAISKQTWKYETKQVVKRKLEKTPVTLDSGEVINVEQMQPYTEEVVVYDAPDIKNIPLESFFFDPAYTDIDESPFACHEYFKEKHELIAGEEAGLYKNTRKLSAGESFDGALYDRLEDHHESIGNMRDGVRIWEYWTNDFKVLVANKTTVIMCIPNPYYTKRKMFTKWCPIPMANEFYGKSPIETLRDLQYELNTMRSQRIDNISLAINRMFYINRNADIDVTQLKSRPNGYIEVDDMANDIREITFNDVTGSAYKDEEIIKTDMDVTSGVHSYDRGQNPQRRDTATVASLLTSASSERFKLQAMMLAEDPVTDIGKQFADLNKQFLSDDTFIRITDEGGGEMYEQITFADIDTEFDVVAVGASVDSTANKEVRQAQLVQLLNIAAGIPEINKVELAKEIFRAFEIKNVDDMFQEVPPEMMEEPEGPASDATGLYPQVGGVGALQGMMQNM